MTSLKPGLSKGLLGEGARYDRQASRLQWLGERLATFVAEKDRQYGSSWRKRGGSSAFHIIARKWDRIEHACQNPNFARRNQDKNIPVESEEAPLYDIFYRFENDTRDEGILDDVVDLAGYLLVLIEHMVECGYVNNVCGASINKTLYPSSPSCEYGVDTLFEQHSEPERTYSAEHPFGYDEEVDTIPDQPATKGGDIK